MDIVAELNMLAGASQSGPNDDGHIIAKGVEEIVRLRQALAAEREACAVAAEQYTENGDATRTDEMQRWTAETIARDIRARTD